ncbi:MAG: cellulose binding domain-containing protein, partial [Thermobispora bispora]|nr:cellulose binding domain-containing protein [Thermobispora bispora]
VSPPVSPSPSPSGSKGCTASYRIVNEWNGGFQGEVTVTAGDSAISGWTVSWTFPDGQAVTQAWNATITSNGPSVTAKNMSYNGDLGPGAGTTFGFLGSWQGQNRVPPEVICTAS